jgi:hypothetical protein
VVSECVDRHASNFQIFPGRHIVRNKSLHFIAHGGIDRSLSSNCRLTGRFSATPCKLKVATMPAGNAAHLSGSFTFGQGTMKPALESL